MPKIPTHALIWSGEQGVYELHPADPLLPYVVPGEEEPWLAWLATHASFSFQGQAGRLNVLKESRPRGEGYWYAYRTKKGRTRKRYLGRTEHLSLTHLEETARALLPEQPPTQALEQGLMLLSSKLAPPRLPNALVQRERLLAALDEALATRLSLLCAPAGFGKTTLLSAWASRHQAQVAWFSLDELDNSPTRFWVSLIEALRCCGGYAPSLGETMVALLSSPQPPPLPTILMALLQELESREAHPVPVVLMVDDYQVLDEPAIHESMSFFLEHLPAHVHLILSSRVDPDLPLARWRVRGQLTEIRAADLRFREGEASQFLGQVLSPPLSEEEVRRLVSRTEGWIAGLQLAALALRKREDRAAFLQALTGSQRYLLDYVQEEVLARLPENVRDFLLHTAILSCLDASVCQAVSAEPQRAASQQMLVFLERANLFVVPLDEERRSYRLHELFREALLSVLHTHHPELVPLLHRRAASFYEAQGEWAEAIAHRLSARDFSAAARLMEQRVEQFWVRGEATTTAHWVLAVPQPLVREHARLLLTTALYLLYTVTQTTQEQRERRHTEVRQLMVRVETALRRESDKIDQESSVAGGAGAVFLPENLEAHTAEEALLHRRLRLLHMQMVLSEALASGDFERLNSMRQAIAEEFDRDEEAIWQMVPLACSFVLHYAVRQEGASLLPQLLSAKEQVSQLGSPFASLRVRQYLVYEAVEAGQLRLAYQESQAGLDLIKHIEGYALLKGHFELVLARVLYQWNRVEEARSLLHRAVRNAAAWQHLDLLGSGYNELMQVALVTGDGSLALQALQEVEQLVQRERYGTYPGWLPTMRAQWWLAQGHLREASDWAASVVFPEEAWVGRRYYDAFPVVMRVCFAQRRFREALALLDSFRTQLDRQANIRITLTYLAQYLVALHHTGQIEQAREIVARLFALTEPEGYLRVYLDEGEPMREALQVLLSSQHELTPSTRAYVARLLAAFEQEANAAGTSPQAAPTPEPMLVASGKAAGASLGLTAREVEVLRLVAAGLTDAHIAEQLVISPRTVNAHLTSIYRKIAVSSRAAATRYAIEHHLA